MSETLNAVIADEGPPLAHLLGRKPPAPSWFDRALECVPQRSLIAVGAARLELLTWGELGNPGLMFVPGLSAHADWWSFIAPLLADDYRVAAMSLSGMGGSDWREGYSFDVYAEEVVAAAEAAGLYESDKSPIYVGHSHGGMAVFFAACRNRQRMRGAIMIDTGFGVRIPGLRVGEELNGAPVRAAKTFATLEDALTRYRLMPAQPCANLYIVDHLARRSLKQVTLQSGETAWTWRFDPELLRKTNFDGFRGLQGARPPPMVHIIGDRSSMMAPNGGDQAPFLRGAVRAIKIPDCDHHVMVDQPLALTHVVRQMAGQWWGAQ